MVKAIEGAQLTMIRLCGLMAGQAWGGFVAETEFARDFLPPNAPETPWAKAWPGLHEALAYATAWGDVIGGQGDLIDGWLEFHLTAPAKAGALSRQIICKDLASLAANVA